MQDLTPKESELLNELDALERLAEKVTQKLCQTELTLRNTEGELEQARRDLISVREENQHLREVMQTWRQRLQSTLAALVSLE